MLFLWYLSARATLDTFMSFWHIAITIFLCKSFITLNLLLKNNLVHTIEDGSGSLKYELCNSHSHDSYDDQHVHFYCEACGQTYCLHHINIPRVELPEDFVVNSANFIIKGICPKCKQNKAIL